MTDLTIHKRRVAYVERGTGPPLMLLHAGGSSGRQWEKVMSLLESHFRVVAPDLWGFGLTDGWPEEEDLYTLMKMRVEEGRTAFEREKQSSPIDPERCEWPEDYFAEHIWFYQWPEDLQLKTIALDPSKGSDSRHGAQNDVLMGR